MKIAIIGYGKMGHAVEEAASAKGIVVASVIDPSAPSATHKSIDEESLRGADVAIDFSSPRAAIANILKVSSRGKNIVVGTTGWYGNLAKAKRIVAESATGLVYGSNFSIGANVFLRLVGDAASMMDQFESYDPFVYEIHHRQKVDSPSGTAQRLGELILENMERKKRLAFDRIDGSRINPDTLHVVSIRAGSAPGTHVVTFDGEHDAIELKHTARSRAGFADGALAAAQWLKGKKGFFTFDDVISKMLEKRK